MEDVDPGPGAVAAYAATAAGVCQCAPACCMPDLVMAVCSRGHDIGVHFRCYRCRTLACGECYNERHGH